MNTPDLPEPMLSPDFAVRVLARADAIAARRRETRRILAGGGALACAAVAFVSWSSLLRAPDASVPPRVPMLVMMASAPDQPDDTALGVLFPDATPIARFDAQYGDAADSEAANLDVLPGYDDSL